MSVNPAARATSILVVDDESLLRMMAVDIFEEAGFTVFEAGSGAQGAQMLADNRSIDGLFTDVEMPGPVSGLDLAQMTHELYPNIAIMVVSGRITPAEGDLPPGAKFVSKPYDTEVILNLFGGLMPGTQPS
jgi:CheY-like chemotaxis protein